MEFDGIRGRGEVIVEDGETEVPSPQPAQDVFTGARPDLNMGDVIEAVAEVPIMETVNDELTAQDDSRSSVVGELDRVSSQEGGPDPIKCKVDGVPLFRLPGVASMRTGFTFVESVNLVEVFQERACVMKSVPRFLRSPYRIAMRVALGGMVAGYRVHNLTRQERGWKFPRMLLHRGPKGGGIPRPKLLERFESVGQSSGGQSRLWRQRSSRQTSTHTQRRRHQQEG